jgi:hypothetical protein
VSALLFWYRRPAKDFSTGFRRQHIGACIGEYVRDLSPVDVAKYFRTHHQTALALLQESYDKRYTSSSFLSEDGDGFSVGWFSRQLKRDCVRHVSNLPDAATDYLLFSLGRGRWDPSNITESD